MTLIRLALTLGMLAAASEGQWRGRVFDTLQNIVDRYRSYFTLPFVTRDSDYFDKEYDFVVIGAGSGGCVVTNRLTEVPEWSVLLLEAGKEEIFLTDIPLLVSYMIGTDYNWGYKTERQPGMCMSMIGDRCAWPRGKAMGGTSVINYMLYTRGFQQDYDNWEKLGNSGWSFKDLFPYFLKSEDMRVPQYMSSPYHATGGYLRVRRAPWKSPIAPAFIRACQDVGYNVTDINGPRPIGCDYVLTNTDMGARWSASKAFLRPVRSRKNLHVGKEARVLRILVEPGTQRAYGVEFVKNRKRYVVRARKEVILAAGALNSPQLLMLSGIGPRSHLEEMGIPVVKDVPGVGRNLQDHVSMAGMAFLVNESVTIVENRYRNPRYLLQYLRGTGPYTIPGGAEAYLFMKTKWGGGPEVGDYPDMELVFGPGALTGDTGGSLRRMFNFDDEFFAKVYKKYQGRDGWGLVPVLLRPRSRGHMKLRSKNPFQPPLFYPNYFHDERDLETIVEGIKLSIAISKTPAFRRYNSTLLAVPTPGCEHIPYATDPYWKCACRHVTTNLHHQVGTCKMGPETDREAVVDPELRVRGVKGLRVVDASIMPVIPAAHTNAVVYMIGEKASDMIKKTWMKGS